MFYVYVLRSAEGGERFYLGSRVDLKQRLRSHDRGKSKATKGLPVGTGVLRGLPYPHCCQAERA